MNRSLMMFKCLLSMALLQTISLSADCGCGKKKPFDSKQLFHGISFGGGCGCGDGGKNGSDDIPPDRG